MKTIKQQSLLIDQDNQTIMLHDLTQQKNSYNLGITVSAHCSVTLNETVDSVNHDAVQTLELCAHEKSTITYVCRLKSLADKFSLQKHIKARMLGPNAKISIFVYSHGKADQAITFTIEQEHTTDTCSSNVTVKTLLEDNATIDCSGIIKVAPQTKGNCATLTIKTIMLSDTASASTKPQLEILSDDVSCKHGATFESINPVALFYLQSRGIPCHSAQNMLLKAFLNK
ncbi:MAG: SufD family Fe-S cluster assembly protein [Candidatus Babeliales bacterium]